MNAITKPGNGQQALALQDDPFSRYANSVTPSTIVGTLLKFSKGEYLAGKDADVIPAGTRFTANVDALMAGWVKWINGRPVDHALVRVVDGLLPPQRDDLGDTDEDQWQYDNKGQHRDPWQQVNYLPMLDEHGEIYTFSVTSIAGIREIGSLCRAYADRRKSGDDSFPLIEINIDSFQHRDRSIGRIKYPRLDIVGWVPKEKFANALTGAGVTEPKPIVTQKRDDIDDEIPF